MSCKSQRGGHSKGEMPPGKNVLSSIATPSPLKTVAKRAGFKRQILTGGLHRMVEGVPSDTLASNKILLRLQKKITKKLVNF